MTVKSAVVRVASVAFLATAAYAAVPGALAHSAAPPTEDAATQPGDGARRRRRGASTVVPADRFHRRDGVHADRRTVADGTTVLADPEGDCSTPVPVPAAFESACRVHDFGYDLLRYAHITGGELVTDARRDLDGLFARHLDTVCRSEPDIASCMSVAGISSAAVEFNSWRQGHRTPVAESPWALAVAAGSVAWASRHERCGDDGPHGGSRDGDLPRPSPAAATVGRTGVVTGLSVVIALAVLRIVMAARRRAGRPPRPARPELVCRSRSSAGPSCWSRQPVRIGGRTVCAR